MTQRLAAPPTSAVWAPAETGSEALPRVQAASGLAIALFVAPHLLNTMLAAVSGELYDAFQLRARAVYQHPIAEVSLLLALIIHITTSALRARSRKGRPAARLPRYAGWFLAAVIFGHIAFTRGPSLLAGVHPGFLGVAYAVQKFPALSYPYFAALILALCVHGVRGVQVAIAVLRGRPSAPSSAQRLGSYVATGALVMLGWLGILGFGARLYRTPDPERGDFAKLVRPYLQPR